MEVSVDIYGDCFRSLVLCTCLCIVQVGDIEHLETAYHGSNYSVEHDGTEKRDSDAEELLCRRSTIYIRCLKKRRIDAHDTGHEHDGSITEPHPCLNDHDNYSCFIVYAGYELYSLVSELDKKVVDRTVFGIGEQHDEQGCNRCCRDDIWHIHHDLEEALSFDLKICIGEPCRKKQRYDDLRNEVAGPEYAGVLEDSAEVVLCRLSGTSCYLMSGCGGLLTADEYLEVVCAYALCNYSTVGLCGKIESVATR